MRCVRAGACALVLALALLSPSLTALADGSYQTPNGVQTVSAMSAQLRSAGYSGPWDDESVIAAYARTTGGSVTAAGAETHTVVLFIGGLNSTVTGDEVNFGLLQQELMANWGYRPSDFWYWDYGGTEQFDTTCQSIAESENELVTSVRNIRASHEADHVVIVGHSLGGVVAFESLVRADDLAQQGNPFVRRIVTVDSPLGGLAWEEKLFGTLWNPGNCPALSDLRALHTTARQTWLTDAANWEIGRGVAVEVVSNPEDTALWLNEQQINAKVNFVVDVRDSGLNHAAVLKTNYGVSQLGPLIGPQS